MISYATLKAAQDGKVAPWTNTVPELSNTHIAVFRDAYPVAEGHLLFVPTYNTLTVINDAFESALRHGEAMVKRGECLGYNIGFNSGSVAGQTVMYPHVHLIPRRSGDCEDPVGGVRGVIPGQANYKAAGYTQPA